MNDQEREERKQRVADAARRGQPVFVPAKEPEWAKEKPKPRTETEPKIVRSWDPDQKNRSELTNLGTPLSDHPKAR